MALKDDITKLVNSYFTGKYEIKNTTIVPSTDYSKLTFGNTGLVCDLAFLFVDIRKSSDMHTVYGFEKTARIYQSFHAICLYIIESKDGHIRAFDGDRIMGVFSGSSKRTNAVKAAMHIRWAIDELLNPKLTGKPLKIGCGVEAGDTLITKVGKANDIDCRDLVWIGKACNYAAHLTQYAYNTIIISADVYSKMNESVKYTDSTQATNMWNYKKLKLKNGKEINVYESTYRWGL